MRPRTTMFRAAALAALATTVVFTLGTGTAAADARSPMAAAATPQSAPAPVPSDATRPLRDEMFAGINADRVTAGLVRFVRDPQLERIAQDRAERLVASPVFGHPAAGEPILDAVEATGIQPLGVGEDLGWSTKAASDALGWIRGMWTRSPSHRDVFLSDVSSYAGVGVAQGGGRLIAVLVVAETLDRTAPVVSVTDVERVGSGAVVRWTAEDPPLQSHTAGVRDVAVQYRVDNGTWRILERSNARGATSMRRLAQGHTYEVRVRARDRAGNVSAWVDTPPIRIP